MHVAKKKTLTATRARLRGRAYSRKAQLGRVLANKLFLPSRHGVASVSNIS